jgi:O-acetyl-ADP-ribose deacetylase (regulator of RNase III)
MPVIYHEATVFEVPAQTIINTVNCEGAMGAGLALECKKRFPEMFYAYRKLCKQGKLRPGKLWLWKESSPWVLNFPTKDEWRNRAELPYIVDGLDNLLRNYEAMGITSINIPPLGCSNGGLTFETVGPLIYECVSQMDIDVNICLPVY